MNKIIENFLNNHNSATLATISAENGNPQASTIFYVFDEQLNICMITSKDSRKAKNISQNNQVALVISQESDPMILQIEGVAQEITDKQQKTDVSKKYLDTAGRSNPNSPNWPPLMKIPAMPEDDLFIMYEIIVNWFKFSDFSGSQAVIIEGNASDWNSSL